MTTSTTTSNSSTTTTNNSTRALNEIRNACIILGFVLGLLVQLSTLGANFVALVILKERVVKLQSKDLLEFSAVWSVASTGMAIAVLIYLRKLVAAVFSVYSRQGQSQHVREEELDVLLEYVENRFVVGSALGVSLLGLGADMAMGIPLQLRNQSCMLVFLGVVWWKAPAMAQWLQSIPKGSKISAPPKQHDQEQPPKEGVLYVALV